MMKDREDIPLLENILTPYKDKLSKDYRAYRYHLYRIINFCLLLESKLNPEQVEKIVIAACFHDLGIWTNNTFDYLQPSINLARNYLEANGLASWSSEIALMIEQHHKCTCYKDDNRFLVDVFRKADWIDVSLGILRFGLSTNDIKRIKIKFPNAGFHKRLIQLTTREFFKHPLNPLPMMKW